MARWKMVTFDLMGTLIKIRGTVGETYAAVAQNFKVDVDPNILTNTFKKGFADMSVRKPNFGLHSCGWEAWWKELVKYSFSGASFMNSDDLDQLTDCLLTYYSTAQPYEMKEGAKDVLAALSDREVCVGVLTNTDPRIHSVIEDLGWADKLDFVHTSYEVGCMKPDVSMFRSAESSYSKLFMRAVPRGQALHVGDSPQLDYIAAKQAGWQGSLISSDPEGVCDKFSIVDRKFVFKNLVDFQKFIISPDCMQESV